jgi:predicted transposase YdaD
VRITLNNLGLPPKSQEVEAMLTITFEETRLYQDIRQEAREAGLQEGQQSLIALDTIGKILV